MLCILPDIWRPGELAGAGRLKADGCAGAANGLGEAHAA